MWYMMLASISPMAHWKGAAMLISQPCIFFWGGGGVNVTIGGSLAKWILTPVGFSNWRRDVVGDPLPLLDFQTDSITLHTRWLIQSMFLWKQIKTAQLGIIVGNGLSPELNSILIFKTIACLSAGGQGNQIARSKPAIWLLWVNYWLRSDIKPVGETYNHVLHS